jgi:thioredoxin-related protein
MIRKLAIWAVLACLATTANAGSPGTEGITWMTFTEAVSQSQQHPKKIFIDVYTHWCGWCKKMDATTFQDPAVIRYINEHYYAVKLDAETHDSIPFQKQVFVFNPQYKANDLAVALLGGNMSYPNYAYLDEEFNLITSMAGYQAAEQLVPVLRYFSEDKYKTESFEEFKSRQEQK